MNSNGQVIDDLSFYEMKQQQEYLNLMTALKDFESELQSGFDEVSDEENKELLEMIGVIL